MWTITIVIATLASFVLLSEATFDNSPPFPPPLDTTITCMRPGNYRGKRFVSPPDRIPVPEDIQELQLVVGQIDEFWELPPINVKEPGVPDYDDANLLGALDAFLDPTDAERMVALNVQLLTAPDPNRIFNITFPSFEIPPDLLTGLSTDDETLIREFVRFAEIGECDVIFEWRERPPFYFPRFQVYGRCSSDRPYCSIPITSDHPHSQQCRPDLSQEIRIRALRWDCCDSYTDSVENPWELICGWRVVSVPIVNQCTCMCDPNEA